MVILASEDIGNADPQALQVAVAAAHAVEHVGLPEAHFALAQAAIYLVAGAEVQRGGPRARRRARPHPRARRRSSRRPRCATPHYPGAKALGRGKGYDYPHDHPGNVNDQEHLPEGLEACASTTPATASRRCASGWRRPRRRCDGAIRRASARRRAACSARAAPSSSRRRPRGRAQPLWSLVPVASRARYIRRTAVAMLDELDDLALRLADETGWPKSHIVLLRAAARGARACTRSPPTGRARSPTGACRRAPRCSPGRSTRLVQSPVGVIGLRGPSASPWAEPALEAAAALLAGNAVILAAGAPLAAQRLRQIFLRAGLPGELLTTAAPPAAGLEAVCRRVADLPPPARLGTLLVLEGAPKDQLVEAALWAAFAGSGAIRPRPGGS